MRLCALIFILLLTGCLAYTKTMKPDQICAFNSVYDFYLSKYKYAKIQMIDGKKTVAVHVPAAGKELAQRYGEDFFTASHTYCECQEGEFSYKDNQKATTARNLTAVVNSKELRSLAATGLGAHVVSEAIYYNSIKNYRAEFICQRAGKTIFKGYSSCKLGVKTLNNKRMIYINYRVHD